MPTDLARIDIRVSGANNDFDGGIELPNARRCPHTIPAGHTHIEKRDGERFLAGEGFADGFDRLLRIFAEYPDRKSLPGPASGFYRNPRD